MDTTWAGMSAGDLIARLRRDGITHIAVFPTPVAAQTIRKTLRAERETTLDNASQRNWRHAERIPGWSARARRAGCTRCPRRKLDLRQSRGGFKGRHVIPSESEGSRGAAARSCSAGARSAHN